MTIETLFSEPIVAVASPEHPLSTKNNITIEDFDNKVLILTQKNCTFHSMIDNLFKQAQVHPHSLLQINNIEAIKQLVVSGLGITIMPRISVINEIEQGKLTEISWKGTPLPVCTQMAYHKDKWLSSTIKQFLQETKSVFNIYLLIHIHCHTRFEFYGTAILKHRNGFN